MVGEVMAFQRPSCRVTLEPSSSRRAATAPDTVCLRARSALRTSVEASVSTIRPPLSSRGAEVDVVVLEASPMAMAPMVVPSILSI